MDDAVAKVTFILCILMSLIGFSLQCERERLSKKHCDHIQTRVEYDTCYKEFGK
jgi:hypothetical protein